MKISPTRFSSITLIACCVLTASMNVSAEEAKRIEDNSFLIEEAYNQEEGVIQYIQAYQYSNRTKNWNYTFTNEIPMPNQTHQFSYTVPLARVGDDPGFSIGSRRHCAQLPLSTDQER
jgi:hypothetical protein